MALKRRNSMLINGDGIVQHTQAFFFKLQDLKSEPTAEILLSDSQGDDNMDLSDSDSEEPRQSKPNEKHILVLKVIVEILL